MYKPSLRTRWLEDGERRAIISSLRAEVLVLNLIIKKGSVGEESFRRSEWATGKRAFYRALIKKLGGK